MTDRLSALDGLRGMAALWVLLGHAALLSNFLVPILSEPDLGVDLFIILSGFLMVFQFDLRQAREPWEQPGTWGRFWTRRFFRIAPLYYLLLSIALIAGPQLYESRLAIDAFRGAAPQAAERYLDASATNIGLHLTFLFGLLPDWSFRTPLPDWSIALEMQFYALFPFMMMLMARMGAFAAAALFAIVSLAAVAMLHVLGISFPMPAFLPLKMNLFLAGMLIAWLARCGSRRETIILSLFAGLLAILPTDTFSSEKLLVRLALVSGFILLTRQEALPALARRAIAAPARLLGSRPLHWLGELSFGAYLIHLLIMLPAGALLIDMGFGSLRGTARFGLLSVATLVPTYALAYLGYRYIERPGQQWGRTLTERRDVSRTT